MTTVEIQRGRLDSRSIGQRRVARKERHCGSPWNDGCRFIRPGDVYLEATEFPGHDAGYATTAGRPVRYAMCAPCAIRYLHGHLIDPVPYEQCCRQGLL